MGSQWLRLLVLAATLLLAAASSASAQDRFIGIRKDSAGEVILFSLEAFSGAERKITTLHKKDANIQLLGITMLNSRRGTFSYAYTDKGAAKDFLHTVSIVNGQTISRLALPADISGMEGVADITPIREMQSEKDAVLRRIEYLEQEVRRLQSQVRSR